MVFLVLIGWIKNSYENWTFNRGKIKCTFYLRQLSLLDVFVQFVFLLCNVGRYRKIVFFAFFHCFHVGGNQHK